MYIYLRSLIISYNIDEVLIKNFYENAVPISATYDAIFFPVGVRECERTKLFVLSSVSKLNLSSLFLLQTAQG